MRTYIIEYRVYLKNGDTYHPPKMKIKNCDTELHAKIRLEGFIEQKYDGYKRMEIMSCTEDVMSVFGNLFGNGNPFA